MDSALEMPNFWQQRFGTDKGAQLLRCGTLLPCMRRSFLGLRIAGGATCNHEMRLQVLERASSPPLVLICLPLSRVAQCRGLLHVLLCFAFGMKAAQAGAHKPAADCFPHPGTYCVHDPQPETAVGFCPSW